MTTAALDHPAAGESAIEVCRRTIAHHSKSFAMASRVLPPSSRDTAAVVYTWCRRADDAVDLEAEDRRPAALARLRAELDEVYGDARPRDVVLAAFQEIVGAANIPRDYPAELLEGMAMDVDGYVYRTMDDLYLYCYRVASVVGLMMTHVMGIKDPAALRNAAHLGIAMQLTNICRDVVEDWDNGRLYLPDDLLERHGLAGLRHQLGGPFPTECKALIAAAVRDLLSIADRFYRSGDRGLLELPWRCAFAVRTARLVYSAIGTRLRARGGDVTLGRAYVARWRKVLLLARSAATSVVELPLRVVRRFRTYPHHHTPVVVARFPHGVFPL